MAHSKRQRVSSALEQKKKSAKRMRGTLLLCWTLFLRVLGHRVANAGKNVSIQVYYETLCPDSADWIAYQLVPAYQRLGEHIRVDFFPFGKAKWEPKEDGGGYDFFCQHGPHECEGNMLQTCLLDRLRGQEDLQVKAVECIMGSETRHGAAARCMEALRLEEAAGVTYGDVARCQGGAEGQELLRAVGKLTHGALRRDRYWVPWITVNQEYDDEDFEAMQHDLLNHLCERYLSDKPECAGGEGEGVGGDGDGDQGEDDAEIADAASRSLLLSLLVLKFALAVHFVLC